jgi:hypothetical protein
MEICGMLTYLQVQPEGGVTGVYALVTTTDNISKVEYRGDMAFRPFSFSNRLAQQSEILCTVYERE